jgi:hypothetical protein
MAYTKPLQNVINPTGPFQGEFVHPGPAMHQNQVASRQVIN